MKEKIIELYIQLKMSQSNSVQNVFQFAKELNISEQEFYQFYPSLDAIESDIFKTWFENVKEKLQNTEVFNEYSTREKILSLYFTWIETLLSHRSFVLEVWKCRKGDLMHLGTPNFLRLLKESFEVMVTALINEGISKNELEDRKFLTDKYKDGLWVNFLFITNFWVKDNSVAFEKTDAAIEKSVNLAFDLMGKSPLDSMIDFGKFLFHNR
jgi:AcrR family transcriptional regulator